jgi:hypothetical protein
MLDNKPWYASLGIWSGIGSIGAGFGTAYYGYTQKDPNMVAGGLTAAFSGVGAVVGRFKANSVIGKAINAVIPAAK